LTQKGECGWLVPEAAEYIAPGNYTRSIINYKDMAAIIQDAYTNRDKLKSFGEKAVKMAEKYDQDIIGRQWADLVGKFLGRA
jgi:hypothetical protein